MKEIVKMIIQFIVLVVVALACRVSGKITGCEFEYGSLWCFIYFVVLCTKITVTDIDENGNETRKRIY